MSIMNLQLLMDNYRNFVDEVNFEYMFGLTKNFKLKLEDNLKENYTLSDFKDFIFDEYQKIIKDKSLPTLIHKNELFIFRNKTNVYLSFNICKIENNRISKKQRKLIFDIINLYEDISDYEYVDVSDIQKHKKGIVNNILDDIEYDINNDSENIKKQVLDFNNLYGVKIDSIHDLYLISYLDNYYISTHTQSFKSNNIYEELPF